MESNQVLDNQRYISYCFLGFLLVSLLTRVLLINWYNAQYTDGVFLATLFETYNINNNYPPLYSALLYLFNFAINNSILSGRLVSLISGIGTIWLTYIFGRKFFSKRIGLYAALLYGTAPAVFRWDLRVMTDSLFSLLFLGALFFLYRELIHEGKNNFLLFNFLATLSVLTRYQGLVFLPISLCWIYRNRQIEKVAESVFNLIIGTLFWLLMPAWMFYRGFGQIDQYKESLSGNFLLSFGKFLTMIDLYVVALIYVFGYAAFVFMIYGIYDYLKTQDTPKEFLLIYAYLFLAFWLAQSSFMRAFQTRYFFPFWPIAYFLTALGIVRLGKTHPKAARLAIVAILLSNIFWSGMVLFFQKDSFGSIKRSAQFVKQNLPNEIMVVAEDYKFTYHAGRHKRGEPFNKRFRIYSIGDIAPPVGSYIYIDNFYSADFNKYVNNKSKYRIIYTDSEKVMPILPDVVADIRYVNKSEWLATRFRPQVIYSAILKVVTK